MDLGCTLKVASTEFANKLNLGSNAMQGGNWLKNYNAMLFI